MTETSQPSISGALARALLWLAIAFVAGLLGAFVVGFVCGFINGLHPGAIAEPNLRAATMIGALLASADTFLRGARWEARRSPVPRIRDSLAPQAIRRWPVVVVAAVILTPFATFLATWLQHISPAIQQASAATNPALLALVAVLIATVTPYAEELFFRGWLWAALATRTGPVATALISGALFLLAHGVEALLRGQVAGALGRAILLLPLAIGLSVVRALCGGPRASIIVHGLYNFAATAGPPLLLASGLWRA